MLEKEKKKAEEVMLKFISFIMEITTLIMNCSGLSPSKLHSYPPTRKFE